MDIATTMIAARADAGSAALELQTIPVPEPGPTDVLVEVASAGVAPGMMTLLAMGAFTHLPTTLGHEVAGRVVAVGDAVSDIALGTRVRVHPNLACGRCNLCLTDREMMCAQQAMLGHAAFGAGPKPLYEAYHDGGLAEYVRVPSRLVDPLPDNTNFDVGAKVVDLANAVRALKLAELEPGSTVVVTGATGTMGTATIKLAPHFGVARLILVGRTADRLAAVRPLAGFIATDVVATGGLAPSWPESSGLTRALRELAPAGADAVLDYAPGGPTGPQAMAALAVGGRFVHMGGDPAPSPFPMIAIMANCWRIIGTRSNTRADVRHVLGLLSTGALQVDELITHHFPLRAIDQAIAAVQSREEPIWMAVVHP